MRFKKHVLRIAVLSTVFALGIGLAAYFTAPHKKVDAETHNQHNDNYDPYTYSGNYYSDINFNASGGMNGDLRKALSEHIYPDDWYSYSGNEPGTLSEQLQEADEDPTNHNNMVLFYTRDSRTKVWANPGPGTSSATEVWNREHVWCQSLSNNNWGTSKGGTDILHLRPTYKSTNSTRNNHPYGNVVNKVAKTYDKMFYGYLEDGGDLFEPLDCVKGDVARIIMYVWTTYNNSSKPLNIKSVFESYDTLLQWHTMDRPDALEGHRNDWAESSDQHNRNPFVDHPELAWKIFGDAAEHSSYKDACMAAYPGDGSSTPIAPTGISLNRTNASIEVGATTQLTATLEPFGATGTVTWSSNNTSVATVSSTGLVTGVSEGSATITASVSGYNAICTVTVTNGGGSTTDVDRVASYNFGAHTSNTSEYSANTLLSRFGSSVVTGEGLSDIVTSVSGVSKVYAGYGSYLSYGIKLGTSDTTGSFTVALDREVSKVVVKTAGWGTSDNLKVGDANAQTPGVAYSNANSIKTLTFNITPSDSVEFLFSKRGFIQTIDFYAEAEVVVQPTDYLSSACTFSTITGTKVVSGTEGATVSSNFANAGLENETSIGSAITVGEVTLTGAMGTHGTLSPRYFTANHEVRVYSGNTVTFSSTYSITRIEFSYSNGYSTGLSTDEGVLSGSVWTGEATSVEFSNDGSKQVRFTAVTVTYGDETISVDKPYLRFGATIAIEDWDNIASNWTINDYGVMLVKEITLQNTYHKSSVEEAFRAELSLAIANKESGATPEVDGDNYIFAVKINMTNAAYRDITYCAVPFIVIDDVYYFLDETRRTFNETLDECIDNEGSSDLSLSALLSLKTNNN